MQSNKGAHSAHTCGNRGHSAAQKTATRQKKLAQKKKKKMQNKARSDRSGDGSDGGGGGSDMQSQTSSSSSSSSSLPPLQKHPPGLRLATDEANLLPLNNNNANPSPPSTPYVYTSTTIEFSSDTPSSFTLIVQMLDKPPLICVDGLSKEKATEAVAWLFKHHSQNMKYFLSTFPQTSQGETAAKEHACLSLQEGGFAGHTKAQVDREGKTMPSLLPLFDYSPQAPRVGGPQHTIERHPFYDVEEFSSVLVTAVGHFGDEDYSFALLVGRSHKFSDEVYAQLVLEGRPFHSPFTEQQILKMKKRDVKQALITLSTFPKQTKSYWNSQTCLFLQHELRTYIEKEKETYEANILNYVSTVDNGLLRHYLFLDPRFSVGKHINMGPAMYIPKDVRVPFGRGTKALSWNTSENSYSRLCFHKKVEQKERIFVAVRVSKIVAAARLGGFGIAQCIAMHMRFLDDNVTGDIRLNDEANLACGTHLKNKQMSSDARKKENDDNPDGQHTKTADSGRKNASIIIEIKICLNEAKDDWRHVNGAVHILLRAKHTDCTEESLSGQCGRGYGKGGKKHIKQCLCFDDIALLAVPPGNKFPYLLTKESQGSENRDVKVRFLEHGGYTIVAVTFKDHSSESRNYRSFTVRFPLGKIKLLTMTDAYNCDAENFVCHLLSVREGGSKATSDPDKLYLGTSLSNSRDIHENFDETLRARSKIVKHDLVEYRGKNGNTRGPSISME